MAFTAPRNVSGRFGEGLFSGDEGAPNAPAPHDFSGSSAKAALSDEGSLNEESLCKEPKLAEPFCEEAFEGWPFGEEPCLPASAASDANVDTTAFADGTAGAAASSNEAAGAAAFAGAPSFADAPVGSGTFAGAAVGSTTFVGTAAFAGEAFSSTAFADTIADTGFPQFMQNLASRGSFAPHFVQYMPDPPFGFASFARYCKPRCIRHMPTAAYARMPSQFFYPIYSPFQEHAL